MKKLDLGLGHPEFMSGYWRGMIYWKCDENDSRYHETHLPELEKTLRDLHQKIGNAKTKGKHLVIGNGATQLLEAAYRAQGTRNLTAGPPYYARFPYMADVVSQRSWARINTKLVAWDPEKVSEIVTYPNNPDSKWSVPVTDSSHLIYDLSYNWPQYCTPRKVNQDVMIFSMAKATGHAALRFGWAWVRDPKIARSMQDFVEYNTSGVSTATQRVANHFLAYQNATSEEDSCFTFGKNILRKRWASTLELMPKKTVEIANAKPRGMFLWIRDISGPNRDKIGTLMSRLGKLGLQGVSGLDCGSSEEYYRLNLGVREEVFQEFLKRWEKVK